MTAISEKKRSKFTGRGKGPPFVQLHHWIVDTDEFAALKGSALKMLIDLARQYRGNNNGDLCPALLAKSGRWTSNSKRKRALDLLEAGHWIVKTKQGGMMGLGADLYAITWWPIDAMKNHQHPGERVASHAWKIKPPHPNQVLLAPESGATPIRRLAA